MNPVFADTSYFIALLDPQDDFHEQADLFSQSNLPLLTSSAVILELGAHFCKVHLRGKFLQILAALALGNAIIVHVDDHLQARGLELFRNRNDKDWSLVDCISFVIMGDNALTEAATCDEHFEQAGFYVPMRAPMKGRK